VTGQLPAALSGQYLAVREGVVHAVSLDGRRANSYRIRDVGQNVGASNVIAFGNSVLALGDGALAYELDAVLETIRPVDLAGARRGVVARAKLDAQTGELHLLTFEAAPSQLHVTVSRGALTRTIRSIDDAPARVHQLGLTHDDVVFVADGFVGLTARAGADTRTTWFVTDTKAHRLATAHAADDTVVVHATGPSLIRWTLDRRAATPHCVVLDAAPHHFATSNGRRTGPSRFLWTAGTNAAHKHDLFTGRRRSHDFGDGRTPGALVFVADPGRPGTEDGGWLVGFVHDATSTQAEFVVLDAEAINRPALATVHIPSQVPNGIHATWMSGRAARI
jgi:carotenoid cleavage dioxygenase-like enzyme